MQRYKQRHAELMSNSMLVRRSRELHVRLLRLSRPTKRLFQVLSDFLLLMLALYLAYVLRMETWLPREPAHIAVTGVIAAAVGVATFERTGLYKAVVRYMGMRQLPAVAWGLAAAVAALAFAGWVLGLFVPRSVPPLFVVMALMLIAGSRLMARHFLLQTDEGNRTRVAVYGAGSAGRQVVVALLSGSEYTPTLFVDDNPSLQRSSVLGLPVFDPADLPRLVQDHDIGRVLFAVPSASARRRGEILDRIVTLPVPVLTVPGVNDIVSGRLSITALRHVAVGDLLGRERVLPLPEWMDADLRDKVVMVTGAGGSIGSELCRLALERQPEALVLYELSEFALYQIEAELGASKLKQGFATLIHAVLGSVQDEQKLSDVVRSHAVSTLYHAAAYKHVPLVEQNASEGLLNNTFGTDTAARVAVACGVKTFILISTDKAVRPTNVMGASKRLAELVCQELGHRQSATRFSMVRFGNVLDSSGSVVPLFREQIRAGGPVTVTHPEITRYFMTIREAAELVIQAGAMAKGGEVFVLDMGEPVRIVDLARRMIQLSGYSVRDAAQPDGDIAIEYVGLRPGEKLYEELLIGENVSPTAHPRIMACHEMFLDESTLAETLLRLRTACVARQATQIKQLLAELPIQYRNTH